MLFFACGDEGIKDPSLSLGKADHMLRMPLDADAEPVVRMLDALNEAILGDGCEGEFRRDFINRLMVQTVDTKLFQLHDLVLSLIV